MTHTGLALPTTKDEFNAYVEEIQSTSDYQAPAAFGLGYVVSRKATDGSWVPVDVHFFSVNCNNNHGSAAVLTSGLDWTPAHSHTRTLFEDQVRQMLDVFAPFGSERGHANIDALVRCYEMRTFTVRNIKYEPVAVMLPSLDAPVEGIADAYFRLHLLSHCLVQPHGVNLDGIFGLLPNVLWTSHGPILAESYEEFRWEAAKKGEYLVVHSDDKFPKLLDHVVPPGVRIVNTQSVRLGAHLAPGTVVMPAGFVNFNAGTLGKAMIEGRISGGVTVGARSDIGGGASTMGTLSGGNKVVVSIGEDCLLEANGGLGIPIADRVRIEAGFYLKSTVPVFVVDDSAWTDQAAANFQGTFVKAEALCGISDAIFRRSSKTGRVEVVPRGDRIWGELNPDLHDHN